MNEIEDSFPALIVVMTLLLFMRLVSLGLILGPVRFVERLLSGLGSSIREVVWGMPMRRLGFIGVVWLVLIGFSLLTSIATLSAMGEGNALAAIGCLGLSGILWTLVVGAWYAARALARRRYTPRPLPARRRER